MVAAAKYLRIFVEPSTLRTDEPWLGLPRAALNTLARDDYFDYRQRTGANVQ